MGLVAPENNLLHGDGGSNEILNGGDQTNTLPLHFSKKFTICDSVFCHNIHSTDDDLFSYIKNIEKLEKKSEIVCADNQI